MTTLSKRVLDLEKKVEASRVPADAWYLKLLAKPEENEEELNAAFWLAYKGVIERPSDAVTKRLDKHFESEPEEMSDVALWFCAAQQELDNEAFDDEEGREALCTMACNYYEVFQMAPLSEDEDRQVRQRNNVVSLFLVPLLERACPEMKRYSNATFSSWAEKEIAIAKAATKEKLPDNYFIESLRAWAAIGNKEKL